MNSSNNISVSLSIIWVFKSTLHNIFSPNSYIQTFRSAERTRVAINILFLGTVISSFMCNLYLVIRVSCFLHSMKFVNSSYRTVLFYNRYTYISIGLCVHLGGVGLLCCLLILSSHIYSIQLVNINHQKKTQKTESILSCNYVPFLRDALCNVYVYILLTLVVLYRQADIPSMTKQNTGNKRSHIIQSQHHAKIVLLHSLPWVLSLGLSLPRGLLDLRLDFRPVNPYKVTEAPLSEELCLPRTSDYDIVHVCSWALQAWIPLVLCFVLAVSYSAKDKSSIESSNQNRRNSNTTLGERTLDSAMYSSQRTLYSVHNYKDEVTKLAKFSPITVNIILMSTLLLRLPFTACKLIDNCHYLIHMFFIFNHVTLILLKDLDYFHLSLLPIVILSAVITLMKNSIKINRIRQKLKKLTETDDLLKHSFHRYNDDEDDDNSSKPFMLSTV